MATTKNVLVCSSSSLKIQAVYDFLNDGKDPSTVYTVIGIAKTDNDAPTAAQPVNSGGIICARIRLQHLLTKYSDKYNIANYDFIFSIENSISTENCDFDTGFDICNVIMFETATGLFYEHTPSNESSMFTIPLPSCTISQLFIRRDPNYKYKSLGYNITVGELLHERDPSVPADNWMLNNPMDENGDFEQNVDRIDQIKYSLKQVCKYYDQIQEDLTLLKSKFGFIKDFPKTGVNFIDFNPILFDPQLLQSLVDLLELRYRVIECDYICGPESRGTWLAMALAMRLKKGFIPIRKSGKLPQPVNRIEYGTEYSKDVLEMASDLKLAEKRILIIDDVLATGGSLQATHNLVKQYTNVTIVEMCVLYQVSELIDVAKEKLKDCAPVFKLFSS